VKYNFLAGNPAENSNETIKIYGEPDYGAPCRVTWKRLTSNALKELKAENVKIRYIYVDLALENEVIKSGLKSSNVFLTTGSRLSIARTSFPR
jgi:hypothetical protein